jgi:hypothetical protein
MIMTKFLIEMRKAGAPLYFMGTGTMAGGMANFCGDINMAMRFASDDAAQAKINELQATDAMRVAAAPEGK